MSDVQQERGHLKVQGNPWHYRVYQFWQRNTRKRVPRQVNLCHYFWAVVLRAPLLWFFAVPIRKRYNSWLRPWMVTAVVAVLGGIGWSAALWPKEILQAFLAFVAALLVFAVIMGTALGLAWLTQKISEWRVDRKWRQRQTESPEPRKTSMFTVTGRWLVAKKARVCPLVVLPEEQPDPDSFDPHDF